MNKTLNGNTAGCGPAHRIAPLAAFKNIATNKLLEYARQEARITQCLNTGDKEYSFKHCSVVFCICYL